MYCRKCGRQIPDEAEHCPLCGTPTQGTYDPGQEYDSNGAEYGSGYSYSNPGRYDDPAPGYSDGKQSGDRRGLAIASLVLGVLSIVVCCMPAFALPFGVIAIFAGIFGMKSSGRNLAIAGIVTGVIGLALGIGYLIMSTLLLSTIDFEEIMREIDTTFNH